MLSEIKGTLLPSLPWGEFSFDEELAYFNGPRLLLQRAKMGQLYLAWWNDEDDAFERWLCLPLSEARLHAVLSGEMASRDAIENPEDGYLLVVGIDLETDVVARTVKTTAAALPQDTLPRLGAKLNIPIPSGQTNDVATLKVEMWVGNVNGGDPIPASPIVDAGVAHSVLPASLLIGLDIKPLEEIGCILADGSRTRYGFGVARFRIDDQERPCPVLFGPDDNYLLGASALGVFNLLVDPGRKRLVPAEWLRLGWGGPI